MASQTNRDNQEETKSAGEAQTSAAGNAVTTAQSDADSADLHNQDPNGNTNGTASADSVAAPVEPTADVKRFRPKVNELPPLEDHNREDSVSEMTTDEDLSQDTALFELLASSLRPYWRSMTVAALLMFAVSGMNVILDSIAN